MKITKAECLEFLQTNRVSGKKDMSVYRLFALTEKLKNAWTNQFFVNGYYVKVGANSKIEGFTRREFGRMVWAKNEIKRRENARKAFAERKPKHINCRCTMTAQQDFQSKALAQKVSGGKISAALFSDSASKVTGIEQYEEKHSIDSWGLVGWFNELLECSIKDKKEKAFNDLKTEQEKNKMRDSNAELKEGDKAIVSNPAGLNFINGACTLGHEVEVVKFFSYAGADLVAVSFNGGVYCLDAGTIEPVKTERQKAIEHYVGVVSAAMNSSSYSQDWGQHSRTIEALIDSGYLNTKTPPVAR